MISAGPLRRFLVENDLSEKTLSVATGLPLATIRRFINDQSITTDNLNVICKTLNKQPCEIIKYYEKEDFERGLK